MQNYPVGYPTYTQTQAAPPPAPQPVAIPPQPPQAQQTAQAPVQNVQTTAYPVAQAPAAASGATFNIGVPQGTSDPNATNISSANGVTINILGAGVYPNGANINNTYNSPAPAQAYPANYYMNQIGQQPQQPTVPIASTPINHQTDASKSTAKKEIVLLTDEYIKTLENYLRNDNPEIKVMGAKELMKRFKEESSRKNDPALTALLNLTLQSKHSPVKMIGMNIIENGWAQGDQLTHQLLSQIQQSNSSYGLDALDAASAALKAAGQTVQVDDPNPPKPKNDKK